MLNAAQKRETAANEVPKSSEGYLENAKLVVLLHSICLSELIKNTISSHGHIVPM